jgi:hypothetical protein
MESTIPTLLGEPRPYRRFRYMSKAQPRPESLFWPSMSARPCNRDTKPNPAIEEVEIFMEDGHLHIVSGNRAFKMCPWDVGLCIWQRTPQVKSWTEWSPTFSILTPNGKPDVKFLSNFVYGSQAESVGNECPLLNAYLSGIPTTYRQLAAPFERAQWVVLRAIAQDPRILEMIDIELPEGLTISVVNDLLKRMSAGGCPQPSLILRASLKRHLPEIKHAHF